VVFVGADTAAAAGNCGPPQPGDEPCAAAANRCCGVMNFFTGTDTASVWLAAHPRASGTILTKEQARRLGVDIFGRLLDDGPGMPHDPSGVRP
jgi:Alkylmercury lyase